MKHFLSIDDVGDPAPLVEKALRMKYNPLSVSWKGQGKAICLLFFNASLRTRLSTQRAAFNLGVDVSIFNVSEDGWQLEWEEGVIMNGTKAEHIKEAAPVIGSYFDIIGIRSFAQLKDKLSDYQEQVLNAFVRYARIPIVNLESATLHPLQSLTDLLTIREYFPVKRPRIVLSWAPHPRALPQAVANSFSQWTLAAGYELIITHPKGYELESSFTKGASITHNQYEAFEGADVIYAKNWSSYESYGQILSQDPAWTIDEQKMSLTNNALFMHCLPVRRNVIVSDAVIDSERSVVIEQASNRVFAAQAVIDTLLRS